MRLPMAHPDAKYSSSSSTALEASKSASQSSEERIIKSCKNKLLDNRRGKLKEAERTQPQGNKIKSKIYVVGNSPRRKIDADYEKYDSIKIKDKGKGLQNETEPSKQASKVSGITNKSRTYTEVKDADSEPAVEVAAVAGVHQNIEQSSEDDRQITISDDDLYDEEVLETIVNLGYPIEEVIRLIEEEDEEMISLYLRLLEENQNHLKARYPSYMRSKVSDWKNYAYLLASPENSSSRSRKDKSRNHARVLSYSPKRNQPHPIQNSSNGSNPLRFTFYPKDGSQERGTRPSPRASKKSSKGAKQGGY